MYLNISAKYNNYSTFRNDCRFMAFHFKRSQSSRDTFVFLKKAESFQKVFQNDLSSAFDNRLSFGNESTATKKRRFHYFIKLRDKRAQIPPEFIASHELPLIDYQ